MFYVLRVVHIKTCDQKSGSQILNGIYWNGRCMLSWIFHILYFRIIHLRSVDSKSYVSMHEPDPLYASEHFPTKYQSIITTRAARRGEGHCAPGPHLKRGSQSNGGPKNLLIQDCLTENINSCCVNVG
jgi:hypothetical protein